MALSTLVRGDDWKFTGTVLDPLGTPVNIAGGSVWLTFKSKATLGQPDSAAEFQVLDLDVQDVNDPDNVVASGIVVLRAAWNTAGSSPPSNTLVTPGSYSYDFQYQHTDGVVTTVASGTVSVTQQVTEDPIV